MLRAAATIILLGTMCFAQQETAGPLTPAASGGLPVWSTVQTQPNRYISAHGLRGFAGGYSEDGLEFWSFPLQLVSDYRLSFGLAGGVPVGSLGLLSSVEVDPIGVTRVYTGPDFQVRERIMTHAEDPGVLVRFRVKGRRDLRIIVEFRPSLNLMWPAGIGGQQTAWDEEARGFLLSEPTNRFRALIASPETAEHSETNNDRRNSAFDRPMNLTLDARANSAACGEDRCATVVFAGQSESKEDIGKTASSLLDAVRETRDGDTTRFRRPGLVEIETPDADANRAIAWAQIALEQAWTCNARLGCGLVAGYGPSHGVRRPQYAWFFGGDGLVATEALLREGDFARAASELEFLFRYQNPDNGMMWHEMSQSAGFLNWAKDYPYMYVHVDITFDLLAILGDYARITGDKAFLQRHWDAILRSYRYCLSTLDATDGLPRVPADKISADEQDRLTDELTLSAAWVRAAHGMAELAALLHEVELARSAEQASSRAQQSIGRRYWDAGTRVWTSGFTRSGARAEPTSWAGLAAIASGAATQAQASLTLDELATPAYLTPWGLRSNPSTAPDYDPTAYSRGSVWGLGTANAADLLWRNDRADTAYQLWKSLVPWTSADSLGHMHEVMSGAFFTPQRESVPEQTWSSAAFLTATVSGLLGLEVDGGAGSLAFAPHFPAAWALIEVKHVHVGGSEVDLVWRRTADRQTLRILNRGQPVHLHWTQVPADSGTGKPASIEREIEAGETELSLSRRPCPEQGRCGDD